VSIDRLTTLTREVVARASGWETAPSSTAARPTRSGRGRIHAAAASHRHIV